MFSISYTTGVNVQNTEHYDKRLCHAWGKPGEADRNELVTNKRPGAGPALSH